jgi:hypothetical protein
MRKNDVLVVSSTDASLTCTTGELTMKTTSWLSENPLDDLLKWETKHDRKKGRIVNRIGFSEPEEKSQGKNRFVGQEEE